MVRRPRSAAASSSNAAFTGTGAKPWTQGMNAEQEAVIAHVSGPLFVPAQAGCHRLGQGILMSDGRVEKAEDVVVGDVLMGPDGGERRVLSLCRGYGEMVRIKPTKGAPWVVNIDHVLTLVNTESGETVDITVKKWLRKSAYWRNNHKLFRRPVVQFWTSSIGDCIIDPYFLGVLLGDGSIVTSVGVTSADEEVRNEVHAQAKRRGLEVRYDGDGGSSTTLSITAGNGAGLGPNRNSFVNDLRDLGLFGCKSHDKFIPQRYKTASLPERLLLLAGLMDTDGSETSGGYDYISQSPMLADDLAFVARSCGFAAYVKQTYKEDQYGAGGIYWRVSMSGNLHEVPVRIPRKKAALRCQKKSVLRTGIKVETGLGVEKYYGFTLSGDGRYLLDDFTVTHNTGKTRALVNRIARLVCEEGVDPTRILAVTFSKKGADEMNVRLRRDLGIEDCRVGTWHSLALQIMKTDLMPQASWSVDEKNRYKFHVKDAMGWKYQDWKGADLTKVLSFIGFCKAHLWDFDSEEAKVLAEDMFGKPFVRKACAVYQTADDLTHGAGLLTFDDMLVFVAKHLLVEENANNWSGKWDYVMQDEAQDANTVQMVIARALASAHRNYMVVGDCAQAIYSFRGSDPAHFMGFEQEWTPTTVYLNRNYRSGDAIVNAANNIIRTAEVKLPVDMVPMRGVPGKVSVVCGETLDDEARAFVKWVQQHAEEGKSFSECTALFRTNAQSRALEEALLSARVPYIIIGGTSFYERREIKDLLGYLRVATDRDTSGDAVKRCINAPFRFLGAKFVDRVMDLAEGKTNPHWPSIVDQAAQQTGIQSRQKGSAENWTQLIDYVQQAANMQASHDGRPATILSVLVQRTRFIEWLEKEEGEESIENSSGANVRELIRVAERFDTVKELLDYIDKSIAEQKKQRGGVEGQGNRVLLMSIHRSKGLEWPCVWVVGCNEAILPHARGDIEEERRLMYVAVTRARDELVLSWVLRMALKGGMKTMQPSCFIADAGLSTVEEPDVRPADVAALADDLVALKHHEEEIRQAQLLQLLD